MDPKLRPNQSLYFDILRRIRPEQRLEKAIELLETANELLLLGIRERYPNACEADIRKVYLSQIAACHNRNY